MMNTYYEYRELGVTPAGLISRKNAATYLGLKPKTLRCWNAAGRHADYFTKHPIGGRVFYRFEDVWRFAHRGNAEK